MNSDETRFGRTVEHHGALHLIRRLANLDRDGSPPDWTLTAPNHAFVLETQNRLGKVRAALTASRSLITQCSNPPPLSWLESVGLGELSYTQQQVDQFTAILFSTLDRTLHLVRHVLDLPLNPHNVRFSTVLPRVRIPHPVLGKAIEVLREVGRSLANDRHGFLHRGDHRCIELFSEIQRAQQCVLAFEPEESEIRWNLEGARSAAVFRMSGDFESVGTAACRALELLTTNYEQRLNRLGGVDAPTRDEMRRANEVISRLGGET